MRGTFRWGMYLPPYQVGDIARPGKAVAQIPDLSNWEATARIGELDRGHIAEGQPAEISVVALRGRKLSGRIKNVGGTTGPPWDRHFDCRVAVTDPIAELRPGMTVRLKIVTGTSKDVIWIPAPGAVRGGRAQVRLRANGFGIYTGGRRNGTPQREPGGGEGTARRPTVALANPHLVTKKERLGGAVEALSKK